MVGMVRWAIFGLSALLWLAIVVGNWSIIVRWCLGRKPLPSAIPLFGTLAGVAAIMVMPVPDISARLRYIPLALLADAHLVLGASWLLLRRSRTKTGRRPGKRPIR